jgi:cobalt-zinc-cadmium efflux system outer membrane protein
MEMTQPALAGRIRLRKGPLFALAIVILFAAPAETATLTLDRAVQEALESNPGVQSTRQQLTIANSRLTKARYLNPFNPVVEGGATRWRAPEVESVAEPAINASLEVEIGGQRGKRIEEAEDNLAKVRAQVADAERTLTGQVKAGFYRGLYLQRRLELFRKIETLDRKLRDAAQARLQTGEGTKLEANLEAIRYDQSRRNSFAGHRDYQNALRDLKRLTGIKADEPIELGGTLSARPIYVDPAVLVRIALASRPDLRASDAEIKRVEADTVLTKRLIIPNPVISGTYSREPSGPGHNFEIAGGSVGISIPIFDHKQAELTALAGERLRASYDRRAVLLNIGTEVRDAAQSYEAANESVQMFESGTMSRVEENFRFIETSYRAGKINLLQLVVVQNDLVGAEISYLDALWDYWSARTNLEFAIGADLDKAVKP